MIKASLKYEIQTICIVHIIAIIFLLIFMLVFVSKARRDMALKAFVVMDLGIIFWMVFKILKTVSPNVSIRWAFVVCYYFCSIIFQIAFLSFTYISYKKKKLPKWGRILLYLGSLIQFAYVATNPYHHLFYRFFTFRKDRFGSLFPIYIAYSYLIILIGVYFGVLHFKRQIKDRKRSDKVIFTLSLVSPWALHFFYLRGGFKAILDFFGVPFQFDITPIIFVIATSVFVYTTFKFDFDGVSPMFRTEIVEKLDSAVCVADSAFKIIYINQKTLDILGENASVDIEKLIKTKQIKKSKTDQYQGVINNKSIFLKIKKIASVKESEYIITIDDITDYKLLEQQILAEHKQEELINLELKDAINSLKNESKIEARSYVAKELHDIIGHSLVVAIKTLEVAKLYYHKDKPASEKAISEISYVLEEGIESMEKLKNSDYDYKAINLKEEIKTKLAKINTLGIITHFNFAGEDIALNPTLYNVINKICWELVTNSIKHAKTKDIFVDIRIKAKDIVISYIDNGIGTDNLIEGNGLRGIRERLADVGGKVNFNSASGEGFLAKIEIVTSG